MLTRPASDPGDFNSTPRRGDLIHHTSHFHFSTSQSPSIPRPKRPQHAPAQQNAIDYLHDLFQRRLSSRTQSFLEALGDPPKYSGEPDYTTFFNWATSLIDWLSLAGLTSTVHDAARITIIGTTLRDSARGWFWSEVELPRRERREWTSLDVFCEVYLRFIPVWNSIVAAERFYKVQYDPEESRPARSLYERMRRVAEQMDHYPDEYSFKRTFVGALPPGLSSRLNAERSDMKGLLAAAEAHEWRVLERAAIARGHDYRRGARN